jgi:hypothetical protein
MISRAGNLLKNFRSHSGALSNKEIVAIERLCQSHRDLKSEDAGFEHDPPTCLPTCSAFLENLAAAATAIGVPAAPRHYRRSFTANYRAIFSDCSRNYRVDVLEGCFDESPSIWVNGDQFELSVDTFACADELRRTWADLGSILDMWGHEAATVPTRQELASALQSFDVAWANLEFQYINDLIKIEDKARSMITEAIELEAQCFSVEGQLSPQIVTSSELEDAYEKFVQSIGRLNSVANYKRKGRDDLTGEILQAAVAIQRAQAGTGKCGNVAHMLSNDVVASFEAVRQYLRQVSKCMESLDPHLCNNAGLVTRLVDWEESWEVGKRYITNAGLLNDLCDLVTFVLEVQALEPKLTEMCEDCDVELFLVLPRLLLLRHLLAPETQTHLLKELLPHRFHTGYSAEESAQGPRTIYKLRADFQRIQLALSARLQLSSGRPHTGSVAREVFLRAAVGGFDSATNTGTLASEVVGAQLEDFMRELEEWSIEVQRHCAEDWNQCSAVVVRCLAGHCRSSEHRQQLEFEV